MKKKILSMIMTLAICLTVGYNYSTVKESTSLSISLNQLAKVEFAIAEDEGGDNCEADYTWWTEACTGGEYLYEEEDCVGTSGSCTETSEVTFCGNDGSCSGGTETSVTVYC